MELVVRTARALWVFGQIFASYMVFLGLHRLFRRDVPEEGTGREIEVLPRWLSGFKAWLDRTTAKRLLRTMLRLRGVYIKLGQVLSIMGGFLPRVFQQELEQLQDAVPPRPFAELAPSFEKDFGQPAEALYATIEAEPLAAASLGQVHVAWHEDGRKLAVKVLYPGIRDVIAVDMRVIRLALRVYKWFVPVEGLERVYDALVDLLDRETRYTHEAAMMEAMGRNFANRRHILVPEVLWDRTSDDVLTMTFMEGLKVNRIEDFEEAGIQPRAVAIRLIEAFYEQLFVHRLFHADPHPGNFLVQAGRKPTRPKLVILDFGAISEVRQEMVDGLIEILRGVQDGDDERLLRGFYQVGFAAEDGNQELLEGTVRAYFEKLLDLEDRTPQALMNASPKELEALADPKLARKELRELMRSVAYPEGWFYVERAVVMTFWLVASIDPTVDTMRIGLPYVLPLIEAAQQRESQAPPSPEITAAEEAAPAGGSGKPPEVGAGGDAEVVAPVDHPGAIP
jgi:ubiquinone biosynthesis protein